MGCCTGRDTEKAVSEDQKWAYITLSDFRNKSCLTVTSYIWLWMLVLISIAVYAADTFTAINLLAFDRWSSQVQPALEFKYSKWIFAGAIIFSFALLIFEWVQAVRALRRGGVVDSYMDPLAATVQSIRPGKEAQGFRRFLVFTELTKSKKGVNYIALFVYFNFKGALRVLVAEGPRVVINAMTLWAVMKADLIPEGDHAPPAGTSDFVQFWKNVQTLADQNQVQAVILSSMTFTLFIWVFEILFLFISVVLYLLFLWHYIPQADGSLARYCRRKIETRLERIVDKKTQKAILKAEAKRVKELTKAGKKDNTTPQLLKQPTLPMLGGASNDAFGNDDAKSQYTVDSRNLTSSPPPYSSQAPTVADSDSSYQRPMMPHRTTTQSSGYSTRSNAPLLTSASPMGYDEPGRGSPMPTLPPLDKLNAYNGQDYFGMRSNTPMSRPGTANSMGRGGPMRPPPRSNTAFSAAGGQPGRFNGPSRHNSPGPDSGWSPYNATSSAHHGPSYEMSPVEATPPGPPISLTPGPPSSLTPGPLRIGASSVPPQRNYGTPPPLAPVASQRQLQGGGWHGGARMGTGQFR